MLNSREQDFLNSYLATLSPDERELIPHVVAEHFCAEEHGANQCAELVRIGKKVATCSMKYWYDIGECPMPVVNSLMIVLDWSGKPTSIIQTTEVSESRFCDVSAEHAHAEGEGDQSLAWWRRAHHDFFQMECAGAGIEFSEETLLVQERFKVVYLADPD